MDIDSFSKLYHQDYYSACRHVFFKWLKGVGRKPTTWMTLITALQEASFGDIAHDLKEILSKIAYINLSLIVIIMSRSTLYIV